MNCSQHDWQNGVWKDLSALPGFKLGYQENPAAAARVVKFLHIESEITQSGPPNSHLVQICSHAGSVACGTAMSTGQLHN